MVRVMAVRGVIFASLLVLAASSETGHNCTFDLHNDACSGAVRSSIPSPQ